MPVTLEYHSDLHYLLVQLSGTLTRQDYQTCIPQVEPLFEQHGKLRLLIEMRNFRGWEFSALWEDVKFEFKHFGDIEKVAMVGESGWQEGMAAFCKPFLSASIRFFGAQELDEARDWLTGDSPPENETASERVDEQHRK